QEVEECPGAVVQQIFVDNHSIFNTAALAPGSRFGWVYSSANRLHRRTRESFVRNELLFRAGDCLSPLLMQESERILRSYAFIAEADIYAVEMPDGDVHVVVDTEDEWTTKLTAGATLEGGFRVTDLGITEENFLGRGTLVGLFMKEQDEERDIGVTVGLPRALGTRANFGFSVGSTRTGAFFQQRVAYPFVGEVGRYAALESFERREDLFAFAANAEANFTNVVLPVERGNAEATVVARVGRPGDFTVVGGGVSWERVRFANFPAGVRVVPGSDFSERLPADSATIATLSRQITPREATRLHLVAGRRKVRFVARRGLDAIRGEQDIRVGTQVLGSVGLTLGRPTTQVEGASDELWGRVAVFAGTASDEWVVNADLNVEGARLFTGGARPGAFRDVLAELQVSTYWQPRNDSTHTVAARFAASAGWNSSLPFQLTLGGRDALRGFEQEAYPGGRRVLLNIEDRIRFRGPFRSVMDLGMTVFADAGMMFAGDVPFGVDSGFEASVGVGLRVGFPAGTRNVLRVDVAAPLRSGALSNLQLRVRMSELVSLLPGLGDRQMARSRSSSPDAGLIGITPTG
ncbi:MAG: BamA/TamA family outer membrane protein, partial [Gemmatimonadetes bacterium]|nr:BamA/TamA family outer membrane protein [Gemmatimonadota bacterium]